MSEAQGTRREAVRVVAAALAVLLAGAVWATWLSATADWPRQRFEFAVIAGLLTSTAAYVATRLALIIKRDRNH